jgi:hypothetical protein
LKKVVLVAQTGKWERSGPQGRQDWQVLSAAFSQGTTGQMYITNITYYSEVLHSITTKRFLLVANTGLALKKNLTVI